MIGITASLGIDICVLNATNLWVAYARPDEAERLELVSVVFQEDHGDLGEVEIISTQSVGKLPSQVDQLLVPWTNYHRVESLWLWHAWLAGDQLFARASSLGAAASVALNGKPSRLIRPALSVASGDLDLFFVSREGKELGLARFRPGDGDRASEGAVAWRVGLTGPPVAARAALGPANQGSPRVVLLATPNEEELQLRLFVIGSGERPGRPTVARAPGVIPIPGSEPGLRIDEKGDTHASLLVTTDAAGLELAIIDAVFPADGAAPALPKMTPLRTLSVPAMAGSVAYQADPDSPMRRDWAVLLANGSILHNMSEDALMQPRGVPAVPLDLVALSEATYLLASGVEGPILEALR